MASCSAHAIGVTSPHSHVFLGYTNHPFPLAIMAHVLLDTLFELLRARENQKEATPQFLKSQGYVLQTSFEKMTASYNLD